MPGPRRLSGDGRWNSWSRTRRRFTTGASGFTSVIDCGLFHCFSDDDRRRYVRGLAQVVEPGGRVFLLCFSDEEPGAEGPRRVSRQELYDAFADDWEVESVEPTRIEVNPEFTEVQFSAGGPKAWFAVMRRNGRAM